MNMHSPISTLAPATPKKATRKRASAASRLADHTARKTEQVSSLLDVAVLTSKGHPGLRAVVDQWFPLRRRAAELDAVHSALEDGGLNNPAIDPANTAWLEALDDARMMAMTILDVPVATAQACVARVETFYAMFGDQRREELNDCGENLKALDAVLRDLRAFPSESQTPSLKSSRGLVETGACPVSAIAAEIEAAIDVELANDDLSAEALRKSHGVILGLEERTAALQASSMEGAAVQLAFAMHQAELIRGNPDQEDRDRYHGAYEKLMMSAMRVLAPHISPEMWSNYVGGQHPGPLDSIVTPLADSSGQVDRENALAIYEWNKARETTHAAFVAHAASESDEDFDALCSAQEHWESLTPPSLEALTEVMGYSLVHFGPLAWTWSSADCPRSIRDLLDGGNPGEIIAARAYMHLLRMTGSKSPALLTPPISGLFPAFDPTDVADDATGDMERAWKAHHGTVDPHPQRVAELATWNRSPFEDGVTDPGGMQALLHYSSALSRHAQTIIAEYEGLGGRFNLVQQPDGVVWFGTVLARGGGRRADEIDYLVSNRPHLKRTIAEIIRKRDGVVGERHTPEMAS